MSYTDAIARGLQRRQEQEERGETSHVSSAQQRITDQRAVFGANSVDFDKVPESIRGATTGYAGAINRGLQLKNARQQAVAGAVAPSLYAQQIDRDYASRMQGNRVPERQNLEAALDEKLYSRRDRDQEAYDKIVAARQAYGHNPQAAYLKDAYDELVRKYGTEAEIQDRVSKINAYQASKDAAATDAMRRQLEALGSATSRGNGSGQNEMEKDLYQWVQLLAQADRESGSPVVTTTRQQIKDLENKYGSIDALRSSLDVAQARNGDFAALQRVVENGQSITSPTSTDGGASGGNWFTNLFGNSAVQNGGSFTDPVPEISLDELKVLRANAQDDEQRQYYSRLIDQKILTQDAIVLAYTPMRGTGNSVLQEMYEVARMKDSSEKRKRKDAVLSQMERMGISTRNYAIYSGDSNLTWNNFDEWLGSSIMSGLAGLSSSFANTLDALIGKPLSSAGWESNPISQMAKEANLSKDIFQSDAAMQAARLGGGGWNFATNAVEGITGAIPDAIMALYSGGASMGAEGLSKTAAYFSGNFLTKAGLTVERMMQNPFFWTSFARELGDNYNEAMETLTDENGNLTDANAAKAALGATFASLANAAIEIGIDGGSGIQGLPSDIAKGGNKLLAWALSSLEEGGEEILQGGVNNLVSSVVYGTDAPIANAEQMFKEGLLGTVSGMALGGGQMALNSALSAGAKANTDARQDVDAQDNAATGADTSTKPGTGSSVDAGTATTPGAVPYIRPSVPEQVSPVEDIAERLIPVQSALTQYQQTGSVSGRAAEIILSQATAVSQLQSQTGVEITGTKAQQRAAVEAAIARLSEIQTKAQLESTPAASPAANAFRAAAREVMGLPETSTVSTVEKNTSPSDTAKADAEHYWWDGMTDAEFLDAMADRAYAEDPRRGIEDPLAGRDEVNVGSRSVKAYQYENPEVQPFFQYEAAMMASELQDSTKGERFYNEDVYYSSGGEKGYSGVKRHTSDSIATLLDDYHMTYDQIENALYDIIKDRGSENNAAAKRVELVLNDRLLNGYTDFYSGKSVPPNQGYLDLLRARQEGESDTNPGEWSVGAANADFSGKAAYYELLSDKNSQPDRPGDVRPMELPKTDIKGNPISAVAANVYGSGKVTTDELASLMEEPTARGALSYVRISNDQATQKAANTISNSGNWDEAFRQWVTDVNAGKTGAEMAARGALILNHFAMVHTQATQAGDTGFSESAKNNWLSALSSMQCLGTNTAQGLQAFRILRELSPPDKIAFIEATVRKLGNEMGIDFQIGQDLYDAYTNATTDEARNAALDDIQQNVADQIPSTLLDKWNALRYTNMLGNLKTNVRNIAGNVGAGAMYRVKDQIAATMEDVLHAATGGKFERTKSHTVSRELLNACKQDFDNVSGIVRNGGKYGSRDSSSGQFIQGAMDKRRIFKSDNKILNAAMAPMEAYRKASNWMMNNQYFGDEAFGKAAYARSLAGYLKAHGVTDTDLSKVDTSLMDKARAYAVQEAQEATFHDNSALARAFSNVKRDAGVFGEGIMPFTKTPANVLTRAYEFSPLGLIDTMAKAVTAAKGKGNVTGTDVINSLSKTLTGTAIFALGAWLKHHGFLTGGPDDDDEKDAFDKLNGDQNYAIRFTVGGKTYNYTFDWLTPAAMPLFMGAQLMDILDKGFENITFADLENVFTSIADPMLQMSMLQSLNDSLDNIKYSDNNLGQFFINAAVSYLTQGLSNTLVGQIERSTEKNRMTTYVDKNSQLPAWLQRLLGSISQKIPGWDFQQTEYINAYGEKEKNVSGIAGIIYNTLSPGYISEEKSIVLSDEIYRLYNSGVDENVFLDTPSTKISYTDANGVSHKDYNLTQKEAAVLKEVYGKTSVSILSDMIESKGYAALSDAQKAKAFEYVYDYAREAARTEAIEGYTGMAGWMEGIQGNEASAVIRKVVGGDMQSAATALKSTWRNGHDDSEALEHMEQAYATYAAMSPDEKSAILEDAPTAVQNYIQFRENGGKAGGYAAIYKPVTLADSTMSDVTDVFGNDGKILPSTQNDIENAYSQYRHLTDEQKQTVMENSSKAAQRMFQAKDAKIPTKTFTDLYKTYYDITHGDGKPADQAQEWGYELQKAVESHKITAEQANVLKSCMGISSGFTLGTETFDKYISAGASADQATQIMDLLDGIEPEEGYTNVRTIQKLESIVGYSGMTDEERAEVMKIYTSDKQDDAIDAFLDAGYSTGDYVQAYRVYLDQDGGKTRTINFLQQKYGYSSQEALAIYNLITGK